MKKLMIAAAVALAGISLNAASVQWSIDAKSFFMSAGVGSYPNNQTVYLLDASADGFATLTGELSSGANYSTYGGLAGLMTEAIFTDLVVDSANTYSASAPGSAVHKKNYAKLAADEKENNTAPVDAGVANNYAIFVAEEDNYLISAPASGLAYSSSPDDGNPAMFGENKFLAAGESEGGASNWNLYQGTTPEPPPGPEGVPEPTSGLLLLVGLAGLALKRKIA